MVKYSDEFAEISDITLRYNNQKTQNENLTARHQSSGSDMEEIMEKMEKYKKQAGEQTLTYTNKLAEEQSALQEIEHEKANLMIGNNEQTEMRLKTTSQEGIILMSVKSLFQKIAHRSEQNGQAVEFIYGSAIPQQSVEDQGRQEEYEPAECEKQLETIRAYV